MFDAVTAVAVYVTDKERAKSFYTEVLGFEVAVDLGPELCFLRSKSGKIDVYLEGGMKPAAVDRSSSRLSFFLRTEEPARETHAKLREAGVKLLQDAPEAVDERTACFQAVDPDGNILEVCGSR
jgi:predicted enzyme related to lactoylglutathione lyase